MTFITVTNPQSRIMVCAGCGFIQSTDPSFINGWVATWRDSKELLDWCPSCNDYSEASLCLGCKRYYSHEYEHCPCCGEPP